MGLLAIIGLFWIVSSLIKEATKPEIPASYWNNQELISNDILNPDVSTEDFLNNLERGKYK